MVVTALLVAKQQQNSSNQCTPNCIANVAAAAVGCFIRIECIIHCLWLAVVVAAAVDAAAKRGGVFFFGLVRISAEDSCYRFRVIDADIAHAFVTFNISDEFIMRACASI